MASRRLGGLAQLLQTSAPLPQQPAGPPVPTAQDRTSWWQTDNAFYRARGASWALLSLSRGLEADFRGVLQDKNALASFRSLEETLAAASRPMESPAVLSGGGFGLWPNHDLTMAAYLSSANTIAMNLETLMQKD